MIGLYMLLVFEVKQRPEIGITTQDHMSSATTISPIGATLGGSLIPHEVG